MYGRPFGGRPLPGDSCSRCETTTRRRCIPLWGGKNPPVARQTSADTTSPFTMRGWGCPEGTAQADQAVRRTTCQPAFGADARPSPSQDAKPPLIAKPWKPTLRSAPTASPGPRPAPAPRHRHATIFEGRELVPKVGLEPTCLAATDFESAASTIPPLGPPDAGSSLLERRRQRHDGACAAGAAPPRLFHQSGRMVRAGARGLPFAPRSCSNGA